MANRIVKKELGGLEDLLHGTGSVTQVRNGASYTINKIDAAGLIYENAETLRTRLGKKVDVLTNIAELQALATTTVAEKFVYLLGYTTAGDGGGGLFWLDTTDTTTVEDLNIVFNPDVLANGRWKRVDTSDYLSPDRGDADYTIQAFDFGTQLFATTLTANRTVTLPTTGLYKGKRVIVNRTGGGSFDLLIGAIATLTDTGLVEVQYDGSAWVILYEPTIETKRGALVYSSISQSIVTTTYTHLAFDSEEYDTDSIHDTVTNNQRLTVPAGVTKIKLFGQVGWSANATGSRQAGISKNDETTTPTVPVGLPVSKLEATSGGATTFNNISSPIIDVVAGDYFTLFVLQASGGNLNAVVATTGFTYFAMEIIA